ncbi:MAG: hypothetical protein IPL91_16265 [Hyphomicrobium sp.]|nr:hypothetical protein [Hyphomicrobium sp.]
MTDNPKAPIRQLRFQLTREDVAAYHFLPRELVGAEKLWLFGPILLCGAAVGYFDENLKAIVPWDTDTQLGQLLSVIAAIAAGYALSLVLLTARTRHRISGAKVPAGETLVDAYPQLLFAGESGDQSSYAWSKLNVTETATHVFLTQPGRAPVILPLRAFDGAADMANFAAFVRVMGRDEDSEDDQDSQNDGAAAAKDN